MVTAFLIANESAAETVMILRSGTSGNGWRYRAPGKGDGLPMTFGRDQGWQLNANEALNLNLSGANDCGYSVSYHAEDA